MHGQPDPHTYGERHLFRGGLPKSASIALSNDISIADKCRKDISALMARVRDLIRGASDDKAFDDVEIMASLDYAREVLPTDKTLRRRAEDML